MGARIVTGGPLAEEETDTQQNAAPTVTFVNRAAVKGPGEFERALGQVADFMAAQSGILDYTLSQDVGNRTAM
ncbi:hypothetical protein [Haloactinospora alba]|uniref:hypothetical protein n=1 Tax=Haloactinospora alba TaxID=405555 RepID=UPI00115164F3|nr:hypothetical protein [Haloactinospora alba]